LKPERDNLYLKVFKIIENKHPKNAIIKDKRTKVSIIMKIKWRS
jgi:hypothetical protein